MPDSAIRRILVPLDGSGIAERAIPHAAAVARAFEAEVVLLSVLSPERRSGQFAIDSATWRLRRSEAAAHLNAITARLTERGITVTAELTDGVVEDTILEVAGQEDFDLLVMTTHGRGGSSRFPLGGTTSKVVSQAGLSVLLVRTGDGGPAMENEPEASYRRVLAPVDCSLRSDWALHLAAGVARASRAELLVIHVVRPPEMPPRKPSSPDLARLAAEVLRARRESAEEYLEEARTMLASSELSVRTMVSVATSVVRMVNEIVEREGVDLVVLSAHGASGPAPWLYGSVCGNLVAYGTTPLLIFQDLPRRSREESPADAGMAIQTGSGWPR